MIDMEKAGLNGMGGGFGGFEDFDLGDIFSSFFGGGFSGSARSRKKNIDNYGARYRNSSYINI